MNRKEILEGGLVLALGASFLGSCANLANQYLSFINFGAELRREYFLITGQSDKAWRYEDNSKHSLFGGKDAED